MTPQTVQRGMVVVTPTVESRAQARETTLDQWRALGWEPVTVEHGPPYGHVWHRWNAHRALRAGLATDADLILYSEDDIDLDPRLADHLPPMLGRQPCSLWHRPKFRPPGAYQAGQVQIVPAVKQTAWFSSLAVAFTRRQAEQMLAIDAGRDSFDLDLRALGVRITVPPLVEHRRLPRVASRGGHITSMGGYEGPSSGPGQQGGLTDAG